MTFARPSAEVALVAAIAACGYLSVRAEEPAARALSAQIAQAPLVQPSPTATFGDNVSFAVEKSTLRARGASPELIARIDGSPFRYFRLLGPSFAARTCFAFQDLRWRLPSVAVHGDAHLEQFIVTGTTYGMRDFDQAGFGPAIVDLVRYAASIHVACRRTSFRCDAERAVAAYFTAYRNALDHPISPTIPSIVERLRQTSTAYPEGWLAWVDGQIQPLPPEEEAHFRRGWAPFVTLLTQTQPGRPASAYDISKVGRIEIGVGSALDKKILVRTRGASGDPADDLILETRVTPRPTGRECVWRPPHGGSLHVITFTATIGRQLPEVFGFLPQELDPTAPEWWVQSWEPGYRELSIADLGSQTELEELAADAAHQLAGYFWNSFPEPLREYLRFAQLQAFDLVQERARILARDLADETAKEWERFRSGS